MKRISLTVILMVALTGVSLTAQEKKWTLAECIDYAVANNIALQRQKLLSETADANLLKSKMDVLPTLNIGSDANMGFGRSVNPVTNLITFKQNLSNSYAISTSVDIFNGFTTINTISANKFLKQAGIENEKIARNTLVIDILSQFYRVLYARGIEDASRMKADLSEKQLLRVTKMVEIGRESVAKQYELQSSYSADKLAYTVARNTTEQAITTLKQMLQLEPGTPFDIMGPNPGKMLVAD
ncbi:MAG: TolC family protein, partial [Bacteroidales bacterium]|nr:TolC family protein [Bacteroidales bacterium]